MCQHCRDLRRQQAGIQGCDRVTEKITLELDYIPGISRTCGLADPFLCFTFLGILVESFPAEMAEQLSSSSQSDFKSVMYECEASFQASANTNKSSPCIKMFFIPFRAFQ